MILESIDKLRGTKKRPDIDSIFDSVFKTVATNIERDTLADTLILLYEKCFNAEFFLVCIFSPKLEYTDQKKLRTNFHAVYP